MLQNFDFQHFWSDPLVSKIGDLGLRILLEILIFFIGVQLIKVVRKVVRKSMEKAKAEKGVTQFVDSFIKASMYVVLVFFIASNLGVDGASIIAILGSAGVALGLALQGSLSNLAGGVLILILKPFKVGDYIIESNHNHEGFVEEIQIFYTKLRMPDNRLVILPNGALANSSLINVTVLPTRRVDVSLQISYSADILQAKKVLQEVLDQDAQCIKTMDRVVFVDELADSGVTMGVRCFVKNEDYWSTKWRLTENCKLALDSAGIEIPFPQVDVHIQN